MEVDYTDMEVDNAGMEVEHTDIYGSGEYRHGKRDYTEIWKWRMQA